nr:UPF0711 protein C18orf21 homolog isoform X1 [Misgurnus anguillicaudatus]
MALIIKTQTPTIPCSRRGVSWVIVKHVADGVALFSFMDVNPESLTYNFLKKASLIYKDICPEQSRFFMRQHQKKGPALSDSVLCPYCYQWRQPDNHRVRLRPKRPPTARIRRLLKRELMGKRLSSEQTIVLQKFKRASNVLMATCYTCNRMSRQPGANREFLASLSKNRGTPWSASKRRTPQSANKATPKSVFSNKTPSGTPKSVSSNASSSSSKSGSAKSSPFARLKKLLMLEDKQESKKGGLKDFLSSL